MAGTRQSAEQFTSREYFYVGGEYVDNGNGEFFKQGQMYVEKLTPRDAGKRSGAQQWPIVLIHGNGQSGTNFLNKPNDTSPGLASHFLSKKYTVYIIDQNYRGRSPCHPSLSKDQIGGTSLGVYSAFFIEQRFTAPKKHMLWPQAAYHTQWVGTGEKGDPTFDAYYSTILPSVISPELQQTAMRAAGAALLDRIGPSILIGHSQGGIYPWLWADARPSLVKAILNLEPNGPPCREVLFGKDGKGDGRPARKYGLADIPLNFAFPTDSTSAEQLDPKTPLATEIVMIDEEGMREGEVRDCILQRLPARKLVGLMGIPVLVVTAEASYHAVYDRCTVKFLKQAGVEVEWLRLEDVGIRGNGHMFFLEKNSEEIAEVLEGWLSRVF